MVSLMLYTWYLQLFNWVWHLHADADLRFYVGQMRERLNRLAQLWQKPFTKAGLSHFSVAADVARHVPHLAHSAQHGDVNTSNQSLPQHGDSESSSDDESKDGNSEALSKGDPTLLAELDRLDDEPGEFEPEPWVVSSLSSMSISLY